MKDVIVKKKTLKLCYRNNLPTTYHEALYSRVTRQSKVNYTDVLELLAHHTQPPAPC